MREWETNVICFWQETGDFSSSGWVVEDPWSWVEAVDANRFDTDLADYTQMPSVREIVLKLISTRASLGDFCVVAFT